LDHSQGVDRPRARRKTQQAETLAFKAFYAAYPKHVARNRAWLNWQSVGAEEHASEIMAALAWQVPMIFARRTFDKIPHPGTWLTDGCWNDERPKSVTEPLRAARPSGPPVAVAELQGQRARELEKAAEKARQAQGEAFRKQVEAEKGA